MNMKNLDKTTGIVFASNRRNPNDEMKIRTVNERKNRTLIFDE